MNLQKTVKAVIRAGDESGYVAECFEIPVVTQGKTLDETVDNLRGQVLTMMGRIEPAIFIVLAVGDDDDVRSVVLGDDGVLAGLSAGGVVVDHTTASARLARELAARANEIGLGFLDAPVSGGQAGAENGALTIMVGGDQATFDRVAAVLEMDGGSNPAPRPSSILSALGSSVLSPFLFPPQ